VWRECTSTANEKKPPNDIRYVLDIRCTYWGGGVLRECTSTANKEKPPNDIRCVLGIRCTLYSGEGKRVQRIRRNQRMMFNTFLLFVVLIMAWRERTSTANKEKPTNDVRCVLGIRCT